jgi:uridylate kinase
MPPEPGRQAAPRFRRVVIKISGDCFLGASGVALDVGHIEAVAKELKMLAGAGVQLGVVVGGGNILRGKRVSGKGFSRCSADYMGMLATVLNGLALQDRLEALGAETRLLSGLEMPKIAETFIERRAIKHLEKGRIVIFVAGTGNPYFSTDTAAALRALQVGAEAVLKASNVDGIYDKDPKKNADARLLRQVDFDTALLQGLEVMDSAAFSLCRENNIPIYIFNAEKDPRNIRRIVFGENVGSIVGRVKDAQGSN